MCAGVPPPLTASQRRGWWHRSYRLGHSEEQQGPSAAQDAPPNPSWAPRHQLHGPPSRPPRAARLPGRVADTARPGEWPKTRPSIGSPWLRVLLRVQRLPCFSSSLTDGQQLSGKCLKKITSYPKVKGVVKWALYCQQRRQLLNCPVFTKPGSCQR